MLHTFWTTLVRMGVESPNKKFLDLDEEFEQNEVDAVGSMKLMPYWQLRTMKLADAVDPTRGGLFSNYTWSASCLLRRTDFWI